MATLLAEGTWPCTVLTAAFGDNDGSPDVQINVRIDEGPSKGRTCTYQDQVNGKSALYIGRSCKAVGWKGVSLTSLAADAAAWIEKTGGKSTVEIRHIPITRGKKYDAWVAGGQKGEPPIWDKPNAIGRGAKPLAAPPKALLNDADEAMRRAMEADGGSVPDEPAPDDDSIPFLTSSMSRDVSPIAKILR